MNIFKQNGDMVDGKTSLPAPSMPTDYAKHAYARNSTPSAPKSDELDTNTEFGNRRTSKIHNEETVELSNINTNNETSPNTSTGVHVHADARQSAQVHANARNSASSMSKVDALEVEVPKADVSNASDTTTKVETIAPAGTEATTGANNNIENDQVSDKGINETPINEIVNTEWLELEETVQLLKERGILRAIRTVQRYCQIGKLTCVLTPTEKSARYIVAKNSVEDFIKIHNQTMPSRGTPNFSRRDDTQLANDNGQSKASASSEPKNNDAINKEHFNHIVELKDQQIEILLSHANVSNKQLEMKDEQITALLERDHENNILLHNLQKLIGSPIGNEPNHQQSNNNQSNNNQSNNNQNNHKQNNHWQAYDIHPNQSSLDG